MRILIITNLYPPHVLGGYEMACQSTADGLRVRGHDVAVLAGYAPMASYSDPPYVHRALALRGFEPVGPNCKEVADLQVYERSASAYAATPPQC